MELNPRYVESMDKTLGQANRVNNRIAGMNVRGRLGTIAGVGAAMGLGKTLVDDVDDDITTAVPNVIAGAGVAIGGAYATKGAAKFIQGGEDSAGPRKHNTERSELLKQHREVDSQQAATDNVKGKKQVTAGDMPNEMSQAEIDRKKKNFRRINKGLRGAGALGMMAFGAATVLDIQQGIDDKRRVKNMTDEQERNLRRQEQRENDYKRSHGYGHTDLGEMAFQLFEERIGHHKMGNAKFQ